MILKMKTENKNSIFIYLDHLTVQIVLSRHISKKV